MIGNLILKNCIEQHNLELREMRNVRINNQLQMRKKKRNLKQKNKAFSKNTKLQKYKFRKNGKL